MGIRERKKRDARNMRKRILKVAMDLFARGGYENVSMRRIADKIEYSPGTIYRYFQNKDDIMLQLCYQGFEQLLSRQLELERISDPLERLSAAGQYYVAFALENPEAAESIAENAKRLYEENYGFSRYLEKMGQALQLVGAPEHALQPLYQPEEEHRLLLQVFNRLGRLLPLGPGSVLVPVGQCRTVPG